MLIGLISLQYGPIMLSNMPEPVSKGETRNIPRINKLKYATQYGNGIDPLLCFVPLAHMREMHGIGLIVKAKGGAMPVGIISLVAKEASQDVCNFECSVVQTCKLEVCNTLFVCTGDTSGGPHEMVRNLMEESYTILREKELNVVSRGGVQAKVLNC